ncbi:MAG: ATP-binding protein [Pseudomonadota bacterium]
MRESFCVSSAGLSRAFDFVASAIRTAGLPDSVGQRISVIIDEVCSNMIRHDTRLSETDKFMLDLTPGQTQTTLVISDTGAEFDPLINRNSERREIGGHGISIIRGLASDVSYQRKNDQNILTITLASCLPTQV